MSTYVWEPSAVVVLLSSSVGFMQTSSILSAKISRVFAAATFMLGELVTYDPLYIHVTTVTQETVDNSN